MLEWLSDTQVKKIEKWNADRGNTKFDINLEKKMLSEEFAEFYQAEEAKDKLDAIVDFVFVLKGSEWKMTINKKFDSALYVFGGKLYSLMLDDLLKILDKSYDFMYNVLYDTMNIVVEANQQKGSKKDKDGKVIKPKDFVKPEDRIQKEVVEKYRLEQ